MNRCAGGCDVPFFDGAEVVDGDCRANRILGIEINAHEGSEAADRFGQHAGRAAMEDAMDLVSAFIDGEAGFDEVCADFCEFQSEMFEDILIGDEVFDVLERIVFKPDHIFPPLSCVMLGA